VIEVTVAGLIPVSRASSTRAIRPTLRIVEKTSLRPVSL